MSDSWSNVFASARNTPRTRSVFDGPRNRGSSGAPFLVDDVDPDAVATNGLRSDHLHGVLRPILERALGFKVNQMDERHQINGSSFQQRARQSPAVAGLMDVRLGDVGRKSATLFRAAPRAASTPLGKPLRSP